MIISGGSPEVVVLGVVGVDSAGRKYDTAGLRTSMKANGDALEVAMMRP
jgi:hypothetical protein